jgi:hypothetical protein
VFQRFREARLKLNPEKCQLFRREVRYLGHIVSPKGISTDPEKLKAVQEWPTPQNEHDTRSFLGLCTYYRRFISGFSDITTPLIKLTEHRRYFQWTSEAQAAFQHLQVALCDAPILAYPKPGEEFIFNTNTSNCGNGGCSPKCRTVRSM